MILQSPRPAPQPLARPVLGGPPHRSEPLRPVLTPARTPRQLSLDLQPRTR